MQLLWLFQQTLRKTHLVSHLTQLLNYLFKFKYLNSDSFITTVTRKLYSITIILCQKWTFHLFLPCGNFIHKLLAEFSEITQGLSKIKNVKLSNILAEINNTFVNDFSVIKLNSCFSQLDRKSFSILTLKFPFRKLMLQVAILLKVYC